MSMPGETVGTALGPIDQIALEVDELLGTDRWTLDFPDGKALVNDVLLAYDLADQEPSSRPDSYPKLAPKGAMSPVDIAQKLFDGQRAPSDQEWGQLLTACDSCRQEIEDVFYKQSTSCDSPDDCGSVTYEGWLRYDPEWRLWVVDEEANERVQQMAADIEAVAYLLQPYLRVAGQDAEGNTLLTPDTALIMQDVLHQHPPEQMRIGEQT